eukprot:gene7462-8285_t
MDNSSANGKSSKICKYYATNGHCFYGENCQFVHAKGKVESPLSVDDSVISSSGGTAALLPGVANVPRQLKYGESRSTPSSPKKHQIAGQKPDQTNSVIRNFQRLQFDSPQMQQLQQNFHAPNMPKPFPEQSKKESPSFFVSQQIKMELQRQQAILRINAIDESLPANVDSYHTLSPLDDGKSQQNQGMFGYASSCYKALSSKDGQTYCLRRVHGYRSVNPKAVGMIEQWKKIQNTNIVPLIEVFTTKAFGDTSLVFVYAYYPGSETLLSRHFSPNSGASGATATGQFNQNAKPSHHPLWTPKHKYNIPVPAQNVIPERLLWNYIIQLTGAMRLVHSVGLACRIIDPSKILLIGNSRLRINCVGILDVLSNDANAGTPAAMSHYQQEDLIALGKLILALSCYSLDAIHHESIQQSLDFVAKSYSIDLKSLIWHLLSGQHPSSKQAPKSINDVMPVIGARFYSQLDALQGRYDILERELSKELENGRLLRILSKLGTILERPEFNLDPEWSETGDRYLLKLFRDYLFHQVTETGTPWIDLAHIVSCLNKLDAGSTERICLTSRDEQSILVVSYHDLKACMETAFNHLLSPGIRS